MRVGHRLFTSALLAFLLAFQPLLVSCADVAKTNETSDGTSLACAAATGDVPTLQGAQNRLIPQLFAQTRRLKELTRDALDALDREDYAAHDRAGAAIAPVADEGFRQACSLYANELALAAQGAGRHRAGGGQTTTLDPLTLSVGVLSIIALFTAAKKIGNALDTTPQTELRQRWVDARTRYLTRYDPDFINSETLARNRAEKDFEASNFRGAMDHLQNVGNVVVDEVGDEIIFNIIGGTGHAVARAVCSLKDGYDITTYHLGDDGRFVPDPTNRPDVPGYRLAQTGGPARYDETQGLLYFGKGERSTSRHIPDGHWSSRIYADGYVPLDVEFDVSGSGTTQYEACAQKIAASGGGGGGGRIAVALQ
ncbi:MAG: hypothetical protein HQK87_01670, partial [Nitrospinae bacterium]|nr:hypothetical protein [Nitrospinota bacterium]